MTMNEALNSVEIKKILVNPLGEWSFLMKRQSPQESAWPTSSQILCWWCCHPFDNVPAFLPVSVQLDVQRGIGQAIFTGNFCSWNCVKRYATLLEERGKLPDGCYYIGLLAYLTVCKGEPCEGGDIHELGLCDCIQTYKGVKPVPSRETLQSFGGGVTIDEYRRGFHIITNHGDVARFFGDVETIANVKKEALRSKNSKFWGFKYLHYQGPDTSYTTHVNILPLTNRTFNKNTLVQTGVDSLDQAQTLDDGKEVKPRRNSNNPPRARRISRRAMGTAAATNHHPLPNPPTFPSDALATQVINDRPSETRRIMTQEQSLACNDEQQFYTNSLRGFGNILDSMGIEVKRPS